MRTVRILVMASLALSACVSEPSRVVSRLDECGLLSEGDVGPRLESTFYAPNDCYSNCLASASCAELRAALCRSSLELLLRCDARCAHRCPDGSLIALEAVCDGSPQCEGGADEEGCETFSCESGEELPLRRRCDGWAQCPSGDDEVGCPGYVSCPSRGGETLSGTWFVCNGSPECADGADERDCAEHRCADGTTIPHPPDVTPRCNFYWQCPDGSDEMGCAELALMCGL